MNLETLADWIRSDHPAEKPWYPLMEHELLTLLAEVDSLRQQVRQVEEERDQWLRDLTADSAELPAATAAVIDAYVEPSHRAVMRAIIKAEMRRRRVSESELDQLRAQCEAQRIVVEAARALIAHERPRLNHARGHRTLVELYDTLRTLVTTTSLASPQTAPAVPSANAGQGKVIPEGPTLPSSEQRATQSAGQVGEGG